MMNKIQKCLQYYLLPAVALCIAMNSASCGCNPFGNLGGDKNNDYELVASPDIKGIDVATVKLKTPADGAKYGDIALVLKSSDDCKWFNKSDGELLKPLEIRMRLSDFLGKGANEEMPAEVELKFGASRKTLAFDEDRELCLCISDYNTHRTLVDFKPVVNWKQDKAVFTIEVNPANPTFYGNAEQEVTITITKQSGTITNNAVEIKFENNTFFKMCIDGTNWNSVPLTSTLQSDPDVIVAMNNASAAIPVKLKYVLPTMAGPNATLKLSMVNTRNPSITYSPTVDVVTWNS